MREEEGWGEKRKKRKREGVAVGGKGDDFLEYAKCNQQDPKQNRRAWATGVSGWFPSMKMQIRYEQRLACK